MTSEAVDVVTVTLTAEAGGFVAAARRTAVACELLGLSCRIATASMAGQGWRRHGLVKHRRDLRRQQAKRDARLVGA